LTGGRAPAHHHAVAFQHNSERLEALGGLGPSAIQSVLGTLRAGEEVLLVLPGMTGALVLTGHRLILVRSRLPAEESGVGLRSVPYDTLTDYRFTASRRGGLFFARSGSRPADAFTLGYERRRASVASDAEALLEILVRRAKGRESSQPA
jgi:hypothetical protein